MNYSKQDEQTANLNILPDRDMNEVMPRQVTFVVVDEIGLASQPAQVILNFNLIDNPPVLDLNGAGVPGGNYSLKYREQSGRVQVNEKYILIKRTSTILLCDVISL